MQDFRFRSAECVKSWLHKAETDLKQEVVLVQDV